MYILGSSRTWHTLRCNRNSSTGVIEMGRWVFISADYWNDTLWLVTYHIYYNDQWNTIYEKKYLFPKGKKTMKNYRQYEYSSIKIAGNNKPWKEGRLKPKKRGA
jgi:hypothetical protein